MNRLEPNTLPLSGGTTESPEQSLTELTERWALTQASVLTMPQDEHLESTPQAMQPDFQSVAVKDEHYITVLTSRRRALTKTFSLENGQLKVEAYDQAAIFSAKRHEIRSLEDLLALLRTVATQPYQCLVRGVPHSDLQDARRTNQNFPEPMAGAHWAMLDIDGLALPEGMDPLSQAAMEWFISRLPEELHTASYIYQYSSSAGVLLPDRTPRKKGLNVHLFFWFERPIPAKQLAAFLKLHCLRTGFYSVERRSALVLRYSLDMATLNAPSQPHYVAHPILGEGVQSVLSNEQRIGMVKKAADAVSLPEIVDSLPVEVKRREAQLRAKAAEELGLKSRIHETRIGGQISQQRAYALTEEQRSALHLGRRFIEAKASPEHDSVILYFEGEATPGSWFVQQRSPTVARRFGDSVTVPLRDLSHGAHEYVGRTLGWFEELPSQLLPLQADGHLPPFNTFIKTRLSLLLAPTGSGKTFRAIEWIRDQARSAIVVYAAPRIVLVQQMAGDLRQRGVAFHVYNDLHPESPLEAGIVLTTTQSLSRILAMVYGLGRPFVLILDEIHMGLDDAMRTESTLVHFEKALVHAQQVLFMTGTLTDLQRRTLGQVIFHALPTLPTRDYGCYEFEPMRSHPLHIRNADRFAQDLVDLLEQYKALALKEQPIPRTVFIMDTSRLQLFRYMLEEYQLSDLADVVSRKESTGDEIEEAIQSSKPILISTSLFSVGLNFPCPPQRLWCSFDQLNADTNQIVQAINRANRTPEPCEVRIYARSIDMEEVILPSNMPAQVTEALEDETTVKGLLEQHQHIDRTTYRVLRELERDTPRSLGTLKRLNAFQNYQLVRCDEDDASSSDVARKSLKEKKKLSQAHYNMRIVVAAGRLQGRSEPREYIEQLEALQKERSEMHTYLEPRTELDIEDDEVGTVMRLCDLEAPALTVAKQVNWYKVAVLFGERFPWHSDQYKPERCAEHGKALAEKLQDVVEVLKFLSSLRRERVDERWLISSLTRGDALLRGFLALEGGDLAYQKLYRSYSDIKRERATARARSSTMREGTRIRTLKWLHEQLRAIGVYFKVEGAGRDRHTDYTQPVVPQSWDIDAMILNLEAHIERFKALPPGAGTLSLRLEDQREDHEPRKLSLCHGCVYLWRGVCARGFQARFIAGDYWTGEDSCEGFKAITARQPAVSATRRSFFVADKTP